MCRTFYTLDRGMRINMQVLASRLSDIFDRGDKK
jgi:hypothetical protein